MDERQGQTSPILRAIRHITRHPEEEPGAPDTPRLVHSWRLLTGRAQPAVRPRGIKAPLRTRTCDDAAAASSPHPVSVVLATALGVLALLAASKAGVRWESARDAVQARWAALERCTLHAAAAASHSSQQAAQKVKGQVPRVKRALRRFGPVLLGLAAVSLVAGWQHSKELKQIAGGLQPRLEAAQHQVVERIDDLKARPGFVRKAAAFMAAVAACGVVQSVNTHSPALGVPDSYKRTRQRIRNATQGVGATSSQVVRAKATHAFVLGLMAAKAVQQPLPAGSRRRGLALVAVGALAAEYTLRKGTSRELPVGQLRARMLRTRARLGGRTLRRRGSAMPWRASAPTPGATVPVKSVAVSAALLLTAAVIASGPGKRGTEAPEILPAAEPKKSLARQRPRAKSSAIAQPRPRPAASQAPQAAARKARVSGKGLDKLAGPALRPSLLLAAMAGCDVATRDNSVLRRVAPEKRAALQQRASAVRVPERVSTSGAHVKRVAAGAWRRLGKAMALVPTNLPDGQPRATRPAALKRTKPTQPTDSVVSMRATKPKREVSPQASPVSDALGAELSPNQGSWQPDSRKAPVSAARHISGARVLPASTAGDYLDADEWMMESLAAAEAVPDHHLDEASLRGLQELRSARAERMKPLQAQLDALVLDLPPDLDEALPSLFDARDGLHPLDHGSNGLSMQPAQKAASLWRAHMDACPGQFVEEDVVPELAETVAAVARFAGAQPEDCFPASTPSAVLATLLSALAPADGGSLLVLSIAEGAAKAVVGRCAARVGLSIVELQVTEAMLTDSHLLLEQLRTTLSACEHGLRAAVLPHVLSFPPTVLPIADMVAACTQYDVITIVDGTHALGNIPVDIAAMDADAYVASCSTWLGAAHSAALGWVAAPLQAEVAPLVGLQRTGRGMHADSLFDGPADVCAWLSAATALAVVEKYGFKALQARRQLLLRAGLRALVAEFEDQYESDAARTAAVLIDGSISSGRGIGPRSTIGPETASGMVAVRLPQMAAFEPTPAGAHALRMSLRRRGIEVPVHVWQASLWVRVSGALHATSGDFEALASAIWVLQGTHGAAHVRTAPAAVTATPAVHKQASQHGEHTATQLENVSPVEVTIARHDSRGTQLLDSAGSAAEHPAQAFESTADVQAPSVAKAQSATRQEIPADPPAAVEAEQRQTLAPETSASDAVAHQAPATSVEDPAATSVAQRPDQAPATSVELSEAAQMAQQVDQASATSIETSAAAPATQTPDRATTAKVVNSADTSASGKPQTAPASADRALGATAEQSGNHDDITLPLAVGLATEQPQSTLMSASAKKRNRKKKKKKEAAAAAAATGADGLAAAVSERMPVGKSQQSAVIKQDISSAEVRGYGRSQVLSAAPVRVRLMLEQNGPGVKLVLQGSDDTSSEAAVRPVRVRVHMTPEAAGEAVQVMLQT